MDLTEVGYCGIYCGLCASRRRIPSEAGQLREALRKEGYDQWYSFVPDLAQDFPTFWKILAHLADKPCPGCRAGGGAPCEMRPCAQKQGIDVCTDCSKMPCEHFAMLKRYPMLLADNERLRKIGLERWVAEQEARAATGFVYADTRHPDGQDLDEADVHTDGPDVHKDNGDQ